VDLREQAAVAAVESSSKAAIEFIPVQNIGPNPAQPRRRFDERTIVELAESIKAAGVMQPVIVRRSPGASESYELVAGERRWRAARLAGLEQIPAIVKELSDAESAQWALIENVQREDLGAMEKAAALRSLVDRFGLTHAEAAQRIGVERVTVTNLIRLLELEPEIAAALDSKELSMGHGRALLSVPPGQVRIDLAAKAILHHWSVRRLEQEAAELSSAEARSATGPGDAGAGGGNAGGESLLEHQAGVKDLERQLSEHLGTKVKLMLRRGGTRGRLVVEFFDLDHFDGLMNKIGFRPK
jgi:ParB family chromosome partitioning protein